MALVRARRRSEAGGATGGLADLAARAWTLAVARAARDELGLPVDLRDVAVERRVLAEVAELLPAPALIAVLDEGKGRATGFAVLDAALTAGMVEALTTGRVSAAGEARRPTRTDAAMLAPVLDRALAGFETALDGVAGHETMRGYRFAALAEGARSLLLMLDEGPYRLLRARGVLGGGVRDGTLMLGLPDRMTPTPARIAPPVQDDDFAADMAAQVVQAAVRLDAVLLRLSLPLGTVLQLQVGQEIALIQADIARIGLEGLDGRRVATGLLGQQGGLRAIRIAGEDFPPG